jgi:uncharacterized membrane protein YdjX (TVP38/TMEM64 family)
MTRVRTGAITRSPSWITFTERCYLPGATVRRHSRFPVVKKYNKWIVVALIVVALSLPAAVLPVKEWIREFVDRVQGMGVIGVIVFILAYAVATILFVPGWIFTVSSGLIYGTFAGTLIALTGAVIGASMAFLIARYFVRRRIEDVTKTNRRFAAIDEAIGKSGWKIVGLLRLSPLSPFNVSNYFYGITSISFAAYVIVSAIGMLPGTLLYAYLGAIGQTRIVGGSIGHNKWQGVLLGVGLIATVTVTLLVSRIAKNALRKSGAV